MTATGTRTKRRPPKRENAAAICLMLSGIFAASVLLPLPASSTGQIAHLPSVCLFYHLTGLPCPGCGLTRSFVCLGHGRLGESLHWHPLGFMCYSVLLLLWLRSGVYWACGVTIWALPPRTVSRLGFSACFLILLTGVVRIGWLSAHHLKF